MKVISFILIYLLLFLNISCVKEQGASELKGTYLGQTPPRDTPEIFAPGIVSLGFHELGISFTPDLKEMYYIMSDGNYELYVLVQRKMVDNIWTEPELVPFSREFSIYAQCLSYDGKTMFFSGKHPVNGKVKEKLDIWKVERNDIEWGTPERLNDQINTDKSDIVHSVSKSGNLYFFRENNIYISKYVNGSFEKPVELDKKINADYSICRPFISPEEDYLLFHANQEQGIGGNDIYIMYKNINGAWSEPVNLWELVNSTSHDFGPYVSPDGKYLFFSSYRAHDAEIFKNKSYDELLELYREPQNGYATLYWMDAEIIEKLRNKTN